MLARCYTKSASGYRYYGARGVKVCDRWRSSFAAFLEDMGSAPSNEYSLDRFPNKKGDYEPGNCRWATDEQQNRNSARVNIIEINGVSKCITEWAEHAGINSKTLMSRVYKLGWTWEEAISG